MFTYPTVCLLVRSRVVRNNLIVRPDGLHTGVQLQNENDRVETIYNFFVLFYDLRLVI